jgi:hypothetical protein
MNKKKTIAGQEKLSFDSEQVEMLWDIVSSKLKKPSDKWAEQYQNYDWNNWLGWNAPMPKQPAKMEYGEYRSRLALCAALLTAAACARLRDLPNRVKKMPKPNSLYKRHLKALEKQISKLIQTAKQLSELQESIEKTIRVMPLQLAASITGDIVKDGNQQIFRNWGSIIGLGIPELPLDKFDAMLAATRSLKRKLPNAFFPKMGTPVLLMCMQMLTILDQAEIPTPSSKTGYPVQITEVLLSLCGSKRDADHLVREAKECLKNANKQYELLA